MSKALLARVGGDGIGNMGVIASITLNMDAGQVINNWLTVIISAMTITYMGIKIVKELKRK